MSILRFLTIFLFAGFVFSSCQKVFDPGVAVTAHGTLKKDTTGECLPVLVNGAYLKDTVLIASNYIDVQVNIKQTGDYLIKTDTVNGYSFIGTGRLDAAGLTTIRLLGTGRPISEGINLFKVKFDSSVCLVNITVSGPVGGGNSAAVFTLAGSPTSCSGASQSSNFYATVPTNPSNTVTVKANVTQAGYYSITAVTSPSNGLTFTSTGDLAVGNNQPIILMANGTPSTAGSVPYTLSTTVPASNCGFNLMVQPAPTPAMFTFNCATTPTFFGTYQSGASTSGDSVRISVTSISGGSYSITTNTTTLANSNGVIFSGSGVLQASASPQIVTLYADAGPAQAAGTFTYTLTGAGATASCNIMKTYSASAPGTITCSIDGVAKTFNNNAYAKFDNSAGIPTIGIFGQETVSMYPQLNLGIVDDDGIKVFNYDANQAVDGNTINIGYYLTASTLFEGGTDLFNQTNPNPVKIYVTSLTPTVNPTRIKGTFSGPIKNGSTTKIITLGTFDVPIQ